MSDNHLHPAGIIPVSWRRYNVPKGLTVIQWVTDFSLRVQQLQAIATATQQGGARELKVGHSSFLIHLCVCN